MCAKIKRSAGGKRKGAGRKKIIEKISNYDRAISLINDNVVSVINMLLNIMNHFFNT